MNDIIEKVNDFSVFGTDQRRLFEIFSGLGIASDTYSHPAIFTVEQGDSLGLHEKIPGQGGKSLLLTGKDGDLWLIVARDQTRVDLKGVANALGVKRFSFAKPEIMVETMGVTPGSATPFALMHDTQKKIRVVLDEGFQHVAQCVFHPLQNTFSTVLNVPDLFRFLRHLGYDPLVMKLEGNTP